VTRTSLFADASRKPLLEFDDLNYNSTLITLRGKLRNDLES